MRIFYNRIFYLIPCFLVLLHNTSYARQNIVIGELSTRYDVRERNYDDANQHSDNEGDRRDYTVSPNFRFSSRGISDLLEFSYSPTFNYDDLYSESSIGHFLNFNAEKNFSQNLIIEARNNYFKGDDTSLDYEQRQESIVPGEETPVEQDPGAEQPRDSEEELSDDYGRRQYWRNDFNIRSDYTYAQGSIVGIGYNYGVLRNESDSGGGDYTDHDRHELQTHLSYRFDAQWQLETALSYVKGLYDEQGSLDPENTSDDLQEYHGRIRTNYAWNPHDIFFSQYAYAATKYDDTSQENSAIHDLTLGWNHDFNRRLRGTLSGGPSFLVPENGSTETGYNAYAGLIWQFRNATFSWNTSYAYEFDNFDGSRTGLTKTWSNALQYSYRFSPYLDMNLSGGYDKSDQEDQQSRPSSNNSDRFNTTEETYDLGLTVRYNFLRWYTLATTYGYSQHYAPEDDYDEHRLVLSLTASTDIFHW